MGPGRLCFITLIINLITLIIGICFVMIGLPFCESFESLIAVCVFYGFFAGGIPGNGPMVYAESFKNDLPSAMGIARYDFT